MPLSTDEAARLAIMEIQLWRLDPAYITRIEATAGVLLPGDGRRPADDVIPPIGPPQPRSPGQRRDPLGP